MRIRSLDGKIRKNNMFVIVGLGNPGEKYKDTRHNVGRMVVEEMSDDWQKDSVVKGIKAQTSISGEDALLILPETYINKSGESARAVVPDRVSAEQLIVVYDDLAVSFGEIKVSFGKGSGGHNGVQNIIDQLGTKDFVRVRVGIAPTGMLGKFFKGSNTDFVLKKFSVGEHRQLPMTITCARGAIETIIKDGREKAMNRFN